MTQSAKRFILVDDDQHSIKLTKTILRISLGEVEVKEFIIPEDALDYIETHLVHPRNIKSTSVFLDLNMPTMTAWEFLDKFQTYTDTVKNQIHIYILSSSVDPNDIERAKQNPLVLNFIEKPLSRAVLTKMYS